MLKLSGMPKSSLDTLSEEERSKRMSLIKGKDTKPEMLVRRLVFSMGFRYRLHDRKLPGTPDLVFKGRRKVIQVHGCFWHMHEGCKISHIPKSPEKKEYWRSKLEGNVLRDKRHVKELRELGWEQLTIWECETKDLGKLELRIANFLQDR